VVLRTFTETSVKDLGLLVASSKFSYTLYLTHFPLVTLIVVSAGFALIRLHQVLSRLRDIRGFGLKRRQSIPARKPDSAMGGVRR
jgi:hypothetical protein